jgi:hypothetical protein
MVGEIHFPEVEGVLRETAMFAKLGMPRDLNGDGAVDNQPRTTDYRVLPVHLRVAWRGANSDHSLEMHTMFVIP